MIKNLFKFTSLSFRAQLIYGIGFFLTFLIFIFIYIETSNNNTSTRKREMTQAADSSLVFASMVKTWMMSNDYVGLEEALDNFSMYDDLIFAAVISMDGKVIAHTDRSLLGEYVADKERILFLKQAHKKQDTKVKILQYRDYIDIFKVIHNNDQHIGMIHLRFDQQQAAHEIAMRIYEGVGFGLLYLLATFVVLYLIVNTFTRRLSSLFETIRQVHKGDKEVRAVEDGTGELNILSHEFNLMLDAITLGEKVLQKTKEQLDYAVKGTRDGLWDWDVDTDTIYFSPRFKEIMGYEDNEFPNSLKAWEASIHPDDMAKVTQAIELSHSKPGIFYESIHRILKKDGNWIWVMDRAQTIFNEEGKAVRMVGFYTDITKQKQLEQELLEQEEMMIAQSRHVAMGEMIGMIAHQWRQPITVIAMGANNMLADIALEDVHIENFKHESQQILKQTEYLSKTIDDFRTFFRPNKEKDEIKVIDIFNEARQIMGKSLENHNIELTFVDNSNETLLTYSRELLQVVLNLLKNAKEALEARNTKDPYINVTIENLTESIVFTVCDNGGGIDKAILERIFEPYFSTKDDKTGTGLGLYMSKTIIEKHLHGTIRASNDEKGACFTIVLPRIFNGESTNE